MEEKGKQLEEPIPLAKAKKARVLRIQDQIDRCSDPLIGEYYCHVHHMLNLYKSSCSNLIFCILLAYNQVTFCVF